MNIFVIDAQFKICSPCFNFIYFANYETDTEGFSPFINLCGITMVSCIKKPSRADIENSLITAMSKHLNSDPQIDTSVVKFKVLSVTVL